MPYIKYATALIGYIIYGFWGTIFGFLLGSWLTNRFRRSSAGLFGLNPKRREERKNIFINTVFMLMGKLAKADGRISEAEIAQAEAFMTQLAMTPERRKVAIAMFKKGSKPDFDIDQAIKEFLTACGDAANLKQLMVMYLLGSALADGNIVAAEQSLIKEIALKLGFSESSYQRLLMMIQAQSQFAGGHYHSSGGNSGGYSASQNSADSLALAYQALGVEKDVSAAVLKKTYRKLIREFHPDRLMGQGLPDDMIKVATERSQEIQAAYELIKKSRGIK